MAANLSERQVPWCTIILVTLTLGAHTMVLVGNIHFGQSLGGLGRSTGGWSKVGNGIAHSLVKELGTKTSEVGQQLSNAISVIESVSTTISTSMPAQLGGILDKITSMANVSSENLGLLQGSPDAAAMNMTRRAIEYAISRSVELGEPELQVAIAKIMVTLNKELKQLKDFLMPPLEQAGLWLDQFAESVQDSMKTFSATLDKAQKIFDQVMGMYAKFKYSSVDNAVLESEAYNLFDVSNTGSITVQDLRNVSALYGIPALSGEKAQDLVAAYDTDMDGNISKAEFSSLVMDASLPRVLQTVLLAYSKKLGQFVTAASSSRVRAQVAEAVVDYLVLVSSKNQTKVTRVSEALVGGSLPAAFTADVLAKICEAADDPDYPSAAGVGPLVVGTMANISLQNTANIIMILSNVTDWEATGKNAKQAEHVATTVEGWLTGYLLSPQGQAETDPQERTAVQKALAQTPGAGSGGGTAFVGMSLSYEEERRLLVEVAVARRHARARALEKLSRAKAEAYTSRFDSEYKRRIQAEIVQGLVADNPAGKAAAASEEMAKPETLEWVQGLAANASKKAKQLNDLCFDSSTQSSDPLESFGQQITGMIKTVKSFLKQVMPYATKEGRKQVLDTLTQFMSFGQESLIKWARNQLAEAAMKSARAVGGITEQRTHELVRKMMQGSEEFRVPHDAAMRYLAGELTHLPRGLRPGKAASASAEITVEGVLLERGLVAQRNLSAPDMSDVKGIVDKVGGGDALNGIITQATQAWQALTMLLQTFQSLIPTLINLLQQAQKAISQLSGFLTMLFQTLETNGTPTFSHFGSLYTTVWVCYYVVMVLLTLLLLFYGFWASGWFGGPHAASVEVEKSEESGSLWEKCGTALRTCWRGCAGCCRKYEDTQLCLWSTIIFLELIVVVAWVICVVISIIGAIEALVNSGCSAIHILGDATVCGDALSTVNTFLGALSLEGFTIDFKTTCRELSLTTCQAMGSRSMGIELLLLIGGSAIAALLMLQLLIDSAQMHERASWVRKIRVERVHIHATSHSSARGSKD